MRKEGGVGFADVYLFRCHKESYSNEIIDIKVYIKLMELDKKLGTATSEQLLSYVSYTRRWDIIKVRFSVLNPSFKIILDY